MKYKLVIFDFDGTLVDNFAWFKSVINKVAVKYQFKKIRKSECEIIRGYGPSEILKYLHVPLWKLPMIENYLRKLMSKDIQKISIVQGVDKLLTNLVDKGLVLALVTSNDLKNVKAILGNENFNLIQYCECGVSLLGKQAKIKKILKKSGCHCDEAIYIGDEIRDIEAARKANIAVGCVSWGYNTSEALKTHLPNEMFTDVYEIIQKIG